MDNLIVKENMRLGLMCRARKSELGKKITELLYSPWYISALALGVLICYCLDMDVLSYGILTAACVVTFLFCEDATPILPPLLLSPFVPSMGWYRVGQSYGAWSTAAFVIYAVMLAASVVYHMIVFGGFKRLRYGGRLGAATVALGLGLLVSGFFCKDYNNNSVIHMFVQLAPLCLLFFFLRSVIKWEKQKLTYYAVAVMAAGIVMCAALAECYLFNKPFIESGFTSKAELVAGWGISNNIGAAVLQAIPLTFFLACKEEKFAWFYYLVAVIMEVCIVFTFSRAALLISVPVFGACVIVSCFKARNRKQMWIVTGALAVAGIAGLIVMFDKIMGMMSFYLENGFNDRGRFSIYKKGFEFFAKYPIFGVGLHHTDLTQGITHSYFFHNTPIQFLAAGGIVGILTYTFYRVETVRLFTRKLTLDRVFLGLTVAGIVFTALLDTGFMRFFSQVFTVSALLFSERDLDYADWFYSCPALGKRKPLFVR